MSLNSIAISRPAYSQRVAATHSRSNEARSAGLASWGGLLLAAVAVGGISGSMPAVQPLATAALRAASGPVAEAAATVAQASPAPVADGLVKALPPVLGFAEPARPLLKFNPDDAYYDQLRARLKWVDVKMGDARLQTPDVGSRILLAQSAARRARLDDVGLSFRDVYGIINAETSWIPRMGASKDGTPNLGIAQFEPATARALGLRDPHDPVEAVHIAALHLKEAAIWSARRISSLKLSDAQRALKLREGVSIYYNLSSKGRSQWNGLNTAKLPVETRRHISNARRGAEEAGELAAELASIRARTQAPGVMTAGFNRNDS